MIDWAFISSLEGGRHLEGYVPAAGKSGVTIATGCDLGQKSLDELRAMDITPELLDRLGDYCLRTGQRAHSYLIDHPLTVTDAEAEELDIAFRGDILYDLIERYNYDAMPRTSEAWAQLTDAQQTVIASIAFQYGPNLGAACPNFWRYSTRAEWESVLHELRNFGDDYPTRRNKEADYLSASL